MDISLKQLEIFRWVVIAGSITKASHRIGLSQPSISQQLAKFEETLEVQLIIRNRTGQITLTPAGEFWFKSSEEMLGRMSSVLSEHERLFRHSNIVLRLGATPVLRGRFTAAAARIAQQDAHFVKFELVYDLNSTALVEKLKMHQVNFAIVAESAIASDASSFAVARLYEDHIALAVPASVSEAEIRAAVSGRADIDSIPTVLKRYVEIDANVPTRAASDDWYRHTMPFAMPALGAPTFAASVEFVAEGLATCHVPLSLLPNLSHSTRQRLRIYVIPGMSRIACLAMRKHLLTHPSYARLYHGLIDFCQNEYASEMLESDIRCISSLLSDVAPVPLRSAKVAKVRPMTSIGTSAAT